MRLLSSYLILANGLFKKRLGFVNENLSAITKRTKAFCLFFISSKNKTKGFGFD